MRIAFAFDYYTCLFERSEIDSARGNNTVQCTKKSRALCIVFVRIPLWRAKHHPNNLCFWQQCSVLIGGAHKSKRRISVQQRLLNIRTLHRIFSNQTHQTFTLRGRQEHLYVQIYKISHGVEGLAHVEICGLESPPAVVHPQQEVALVLAATLRVHVARGADG